MSNPLKQAFGHYLKACGLPVSAVYLYDEDAPVSVELELDRHDTAQFLRYAFRFDLAQRFIEAVNELVLIVRHSGRSEFTRQVYKADDVALTQAELDQILSIYKARFHDPLKRLAGLVELVGAAVEGPPPTLIREFVTPGQFTVRVSALPDDDIYIETWNPSDDWSHLEDLEKSPYVFCQLDCVITNPSGEVIGTSHLGRTSESYDDPHKFARSIWKHFGRDLVTEAIHSVRNKYPRQQSARLTTAQAA